MIKLKNGKLLGIIFLFQGLTSLICGAVLVNPILGIQTTKEIIDSIIKNSNTLYIAVLIDTFTAIGIIFLAVLLFRTLFHISKTASLAALCFYVLEAGILVFSKILLFMGTTYAVNGGGDSVLLSSILESVKFSYTVHLLPFGLGGFIFYVLLYKSQVVPKGISLWGVISIVPFIITIPFSMLQFNVPFLIYLPYAPFEFFVGIYLIVKGFKETR